MGEILFLDPSKQPQISVNNWFYDDHSEEYILEWLVYHTQPGSLPFYIEHLRIVSRNDFHVTPEFFWDSHVDAHSPRIVSTHTFVDYNDAETFVYHWGKPGGELY